MKRRFRAHDLRPDRARGAALPERTAFSYLPDGELATAPQRIAYAAAGQHPPRGQPVPPVGAADGAVAILAPNIPATHYALWGAQVAGRACPINFMLQPDHVAALLDASGAKVVVALGPNAELDVWSACRRCRACVAHRAGHRRQLRAGAGAGSRRSRLRSAARAGAHRVFTPAAPPARPSWCSTRTATRRTRAGSRTASTASTSTRWRSTASRCSTSPVPSSGLALLAIGGTQVLPTVSGMRNAGFLRNYWKFCEREASPRSPACRPSSRACATCRSMRTSRACAWPTPAARRCRPSWPRASRKRWASPCATSWA